MLGSFFSGLRTNNNEPAHTRRNFERRNCDRCVCVIDGRLYPVENWSPGGLLVSADDRVFESEQPSFPLSMKFKLQDAVLDVPHAGKIVRKGNGRIAIEFQPVTERIRRNFQRVIEDCITNEFAESQLA